MAEGGYVELELARVKWWRWEMLGWPEMSPTTTLAVAGVRARLGMVLWVGEASWESRDET